MEFVVCILHISVGIRWKVLPCGLSAETKIAYFTTFLVLLLSVTGEQMNTLQLEINP
jgi:hypothetical protein